MQAREKDPNWQRQESEVLREDPAQVRRREVRHKVPARVQDPDCGDAVGVHDRKHVVRCLRQLRAHHPVLFPSEAHLLNREVVTPVPFAEVSTRQGRKNEIDSVEK